MAAADVDNWLRAGITAAKAGERDKARGLLMAVLRVDEENELAWLWLSGVVQTNEDRRVCLENVLTLNPDNQAARRGLDKLTSHSSNDQNVPSPEPVMEEKMIRREFTPISPAAAILYPERQVQEVRWQEPVVPQKAAQAAYQSASSYDDVWSRNEAICAYCAHQIGPDDTHCPNCKRNLIGKKFVYAKPTSNMHIYWVLLVGTGQLFLLEGILNIIVGQNYLAAAGYTVLLLIFWGLALGVYLRQSWAHISSIVMLIVVLLGFMLNALVDVDLGTLGLGALDSSIRDFVSPLLGGLLDFLKTFEAATAVLGLFYGIFKAGPDFEQIESKRVATVTKGRRTAADYHTIANKLAQKGMWAEAALHWQRAAAQEPGQVAYQKQLGVTYAQLGFFQRSLDVLQSAHNLSSYPPMKASLAKQLQLVKEKLKLSVQPEDISRKG